MDSSWYLPLALALLILSCLVLGTFGADSRLGFGGQRSDAKERWFVHSKDDYRR